MDAISQMSYGDSQESFESPSPSPSPTHVALHRINTVSMIHEEKCFCCGFSSTPESRLIKCSFCPMSYHYECLPAGTVITTPRWGCPSHKCAVCAAPSSKSKGRMFRCVFCPTAYCLAHVSQTCKKIDENPYENSGYNCSTFKFIVCDHCDSRNDEYFQKRKLAFLSGSTDDNETRPLKRSRTDSYSSVGSAEERAMSYASSPNDSPVIGRARQKPDDELVQIFKEVIGSKFRLQKQLADEIGISQPILSQFLNSATRNNGWRLLEEKLRSWWGIKKQEFETYKEQKKLARLSNDTAKGQIKAERRNRAIRSAYHYVDNGTRCGSIDSQSSNEFTETHGSGDSYNSGESDYSPRNSLTSKEEAVQPVVKMQYAGYTAEPSSTPQYAYVYSYPTHAPENYSYPQLQKNFMTSVPLNQHAEAQQTHQIALQSYASNYEQHNTAPVASHNAQNMHSSQQSHAQPQSYVMLDYNNYWAADVFPQHYH